MCVCGGIYRQSNLRTGLHIPPCLLPPPPHVSVILKQMNYGTAIEGNILVTNAFNTFYLRLYGVRHTVKDHSDSER